ncbi:MAG: universal stress protein, partial [Chloroflexota bacterium]
TAMSSQGRYKKILVPLDGSGWAQRALPHAVDIARSNPDAELILLHIYVPTSRDYTDQLALAGQTGQETYAQEHMKQYLIGLRTELRDEDVQVRVQVVQAAGDVATWICNYSNGEGVDLVVMSTHGRTGLARLILGSTAHNVMERIGIPVLLIRPDKE